MARAKEIAGLNDFGLPLALTGDHYAALHECMQDVFNAAGKFRSEWEATGDRECLGIAQDLEIKGTLLKGLHIMRLEHREWVTPVASPQSLADVLPFFRYALELCVKQSYAVQFPIDGLQPALAHLQQQVARSRQSLAEEEWQTTPAGEQHAQGFAAARMCDSEAGQPAGSWEDAFASLQHLCQELAQVLEQLQNTLAHGPASGQVPAIQAWQRSFKTVLATDLTTPGSRPSGPLPPSAPPPRIAAQATPVARQPTTAASARQHTPRTAQHAGPAKPGGRHQVFRKARTGPAAPPLEQSAVGLGQVNVQPRHPVPAESSAFPPPSRLASLPSSPRAAGQSPGSAAAAPSPSAAMAVEPVVDPAAAAAEQRRQEQLAALEAALAPLRAEARRLYCAAQAGTLPGVQAGTPWASFSHQFAAWQMAAQAYDVCAEALVTQAEALFGADGSDATVRRLQQEIRKTARGALDGAMQAADDTLAAFSQVHRESLVFGPPENADADFYADLAAQCRELHRSWLQAPLRPRLSNLQLEARMAQYEAYAVLCDVRQHQEEDQVEALSNAQQLEKAAALARLAMASIPPRSLGPLLEEFHLSCTHLRSNTLYQAGLLETLDIGEMLDGLIEPMVPALRRGQEISAACGLLLAGDPLPDGAASAPWAPPEGDRLLLENVHAAADTARAQREKAIHLPDDAPKDAVRELQAGQTGLHWMERIAQTIDSSVSGFHDLAAALDHTPPVEQRALVSRHAQDWRRRESALSALVVDQVNLLTTDAQLREEEEKQIPGRRSFDEATVLLLKRSGSWLRFSRRVAATMRVSLETLEQVLQCRETAGRTLRDFQPGRLKQPFRPELIATAHARVAKELDAGMYVIKAFLYADHGHIESEYWASGRKWKDTTHSALKRRIECEKFMIQAKLLLAWAGHARPQEPGSLDGPQQIEAAKAACQTVANGLAEVIKDLGQQTVLTEHSGKRQMELTLIENVRRPVLQLLVDLIRTPAPAAAAGSSQMATSDAGPGGAAPAEGAAYRRRAQRG